MHLNFSIHSASSPATYGVRSISSRLLPAWKHQLLNEYPRLLMHHFVLAALINCPISICLVDRYSRRLQLVRTNWNDSPYFSCNFDVILTYFTKQTTSWLQVYLLVFTKSWSWPFQVVFQPEGIGIFRRFAERRWTWNDLHVSHCDLKREYAIIFNYSWTLTSDLNFCIRR